MKTIIFVFTLFTFAAFGLQAQAPARTPKVTQTQVRQQKQIKAGVRSGELTRPEGVQLENQQHRIHHQKKMAQADGVVTPQERQRIRHMQKRAGATIHHQKNDQQERH